MALSEEELNHGSKSALYVVVKNDRIYVNDDSCINKTIDIYKTVGGDLHNYYRCIEDDDLKYINNIDIDDNCKSYFIYAIMNKSRIFGFRRNLKEANSFAEDINGRVIRYVKGGRIDVD